MKTPSEEYAAYNEAETAARELYMKYWLDRLIQAGAVIDPPITKNWWVHGELHGYKFDAWASPDRFEGIQLEIVLPYSFVRRIKVKSDSGFVKLMRRMQFRNL